GGSKFPPQSQRPRSSSSFFGSRIQLSRDWLEVKRAREPSRPATGMPMRNCRLIHHISLEHPSSSAQQKEGPNFGLSGALTEDTNTYRGVVIKYNEPPEGRKPKTRWRLYPFKNDEFLPVMYVHRQSAYLLGRQRRIADIPIDHPSCSKQHAVLQYRYSKGSMGLPRKLKVKIHKTVIGPVVVLPRSVLLEEARGTEIADRSPRYDPEIPHIYDVLLSQWSQDCTLFHNVFCCMWGSLAEVAGVVSGVASVFVVQELWVVSTVEVCR
uniref:Smad nuclear interacting protein 1 n=1 Tax=Eptatretus burgeri TaxID=7764 RepID=A0A8C4Q194_EPTBU